MSRNICVQGAKFLNYPVQLVLAVSSASVVTDGFCEVTDDTGDCGVVTDGSGVDGCGVVTNGDGGCGTVTDGADGCGVVTGGVMVLV